MQRIVVTGGSGKLGRASVQDLIAHGYEVINADIVPPKESLCPFYKIDFENMAQVSELLSAMDFEHNRGVDAIVHLAAIPGPGIAPNETAFRVNTMSTYNVLEAARRLGIRNIVWASSETLLGLPFDEPPPYVPLDEEYAPRPQTGYSLSKFVGEEIAKQFCRWDPELKVIGLRFSNVMEPSDYAAFPSFERNPARRRFNLWGYIDARDGAQAIRKSLEAQLKGAHIFNIANADTVLTRPNREVLAEFYPACHSRGRSLLMKRFSRSKKRAAYLAMNRNRAGAALNCALNGRRASMGFGGDPPTAHPIVYQTLTRTPMANELLVAWLFRRIHYLTSEMHNAQTAELQ